MYISITFDSWTNIARQTYSTTTSHFTYQGKLHVILPSILICTASTVENIKILIETSLKEYPGTKLVACVTDNSANIISACKLMRVRVS